MHLRNYIASCNPVYISPRIGTFLYFWVQYLISICEVHMSGEYEGDFIATGAQKSNLLIMLEMVGLKDVLNLNYTVIIRLVPGERN